MLSIEAGDERVVRSALGTRDSEKGGVVAGGEDPAIEVAECTYGAPEWAADGLVGVGGGVGVVVGDGQSSAVIRRSRGASGLMAHPRAGL